MNKRMATPDFVKGVAIIGIIMYHTYLYIFGQPMLDLFSFEEGIFFNYFKFNLNSAFTISNSILNLTGMGYQGVPVFVIVAGFLAIQSTKNISFKTYRYYGKRFLRIYPLYWIALSGTIAYYVLMYGKAAHIHMGGATNMQIFGMYIGFYPMDTNSWVLNPVFWFITLIIQLIIFFPLLRGLLIRVKDVKFLILMGILSTVFLYILMYSFPWAGLFGGCWLFEFGFGMVLANQFTKFEKILSSFKFLILLIPVYFIGFYLANFAEVWPIGRQLYGIALTLFLWTLYNLLVKVRFLKIVTNTFIFVGVNSFALFLIHMPFTRTYFEIVSGKLGHQVLFAYQPIFGEILNLMYLPIQFYFLILLSYIVVMVCIAFVLTKTDNLLHKKLKFTL
jgi:peptidoglycan/LPS O-acetylase OafA/YrhL